MVPADAERGSGLRGFSPEGRPPRSPSRVHCAHWNTTFAIALMTAPMKTSLAVALFLLCVSMEASTEHVAVTRALLDYVEAIELAKPELIERSVHPDLNKFGFSKSRDSGEYRRIPMTYDRLVEISEEFLEKGYVPANPAHSVEVFEVLDKTASAKLTAFWGVDYMHLVKNDGKWKIVQVLWQTVR
jgi:hypothetical protein